MEKGKKKTLWTILVIIVVGIIGLWMLKAPVMSSYLSSKLKVRVSIAAIKMRPSSTKIYRFHISNPIHSRSRTALSAKKIIIDYKFDNLLSNPTIIDLIEMNDVVLGIEFYDSLGTQNNWTEILSKMKKGDSDHEVIIRKLVINNLTVKIKGMGLKGLFASGQKKEIPRLEFHNISSKEGFPTNELIRAIFGSTGLEKYIKNLFNPKGFFQGILAPFRGVGENQTDFDIESRKIKKNVS